MTCPHRRYHDVSNLFGGYWSTARKCDDCGEWVPWGEATWTDQVNQEELAAELASRIPSAVRDYRTASLHLPLYAYEASFRGDPQDEEYMFECGALIRAIWDHEEG